MGSLEGRRHVPGRRVRRPASDSVGRARRLPHLGPRNRRTSRWSRPRPPARRRRSPTPNRGASGRPVETVTIARALRIADRTVAIDAIVTAPATLLDATGRRIVVQDGSGAIEVLLPSDATAPAVGIPGPRRGPDRGCLWRPAPACRAARRRRTWDSAGAARPARACPAGRTNGASSRSAGASMTLRKLGDRWRAEIRLGTHDVVVVGQPGSGIASSALTEGSTATVIGIVRRPYPSATDRRFAVTPRYPADVRVTGGSSSTRRDLDGRWLRWPCGSRFAAEPDRSLGGRCSDSTPTWSSSRPSSASASASAASWSNSEPDGFSLDDGTAIGRVILRAEALRPLLARRAGRCA